MKDRTRDLILIFVAFMAVAFTVTYIVINKLGGR